MRYCLEPSIATPGRPRMQVISAPQPRRPARLPETLYDSGLLGPSRDDTYPYQSPPSQTSGSSTAVAPASGAQAPPHRDSLATALSEADPFPLPDPFTESPSLEADSSSSSSIFLTGPDLQVLAPSSTTTSTARHPSAETARSLWPTSHGSLSAPPPQLSSMLAVLDEVAYDEDDPDPPAPGCPLDGIYQPAPPLHYTTCSQCRDHADAASTSARIPRHAQLPLPPIRPSTVNGPAAYIRTTAAAPVPAPALAPIAVPDRRRVSVTNTCTSPDRPGFTCDCPDGSASHRRGAFSAGAAELRARTAMVAAAGGRAVAQRRASLLGVDAAEYDDDGAEDNEEEDEEDDVGDVAEVITYSSYPYSASPPPVSAFDFDSDSDSVSNSASDSDADSVSDFGFGTDSGTDSDGDAREEEEEEQPVLEGGDGWDWGPQTQEVRVWLG